MHRRWVFAAMQRGRRSGLLSLLKHSKHELSPAEVVELLRMAKALPEDRAGREALVQVLTLLQRSWDTAVPPTLKTLAQGELRPQAMLALAARGDSEGRREVASTLVAKQEVSMTSMLLLKKEELAAYVLVLGGCAADKLELALKKGTAGVVDAACGK